MLIVIECSFCILYLICLSCNQAEDGTLFYKVQAQVAMLDKNFKLAEMHFMEQVP